jgi:FPC/CPF motif-containing protein YcgG
MARKVFYYITHWETWHWFAKYIIIGPAWLWLCIKARTLWFFTPSNPGIEFGGFLGEAKSDIYKKLPDGFYPKSILVKPPQSIDDIDLSIFDYPVAVKPDVGMMGLMFRKIESPHQLRQYHAAMTVDYIIQEFVDYPLELSVFYYRMPGEDRGHITGFIRKESMEVIGDGESTLKELISEYPRAQFRLSELFGKHQNQLEHVIPKNESFVLSDALNLSRGGRLVNLNHEIDDRLLNVFDKISHYAGFYYGRYDIKCESVEDLKNGQNFSILEFNGCGAEAHHVYSGYRFLEACKILVDHWNILYEISERNKKRGILPWSYQEGRNHMRTTQLHFDNLKKVDHRFSFEREPAPEELYHDFIEAKDFPCIAAKTALAKEQVRVMVCDHIACPKDDWNITQFIYNFVEEYRSKKAMYTSAIVIFKGPTSCSEEEFDTLMWQRLQAISDIDAREYKWNRAVDSNPGSPHFSFSLKEESFYIIGLHPGSNRRARRFQYPAIVFNPHDQFEKLRLSNKYASMKNVIRKRDEKFSGSVNPMLKDFGEVSEVYQYSGKVYDNDWTCPFQSNHAKD